MGYGVSRIIFFNSFAVREEASFEQDFCFFSSIGKESERNMRQLFLFVVPLILCKFLDAQYTPCTDSANQIIHHTYYSLEYVEEYEQASWVYYRVTPENIKGSAKRKDNFRPDPKIKTGSANLSDYKGSGYDRGHLCPAAAMKLNEKVMSETFYLSNMSPQDPGLNRYQWKDLEAQVRTWALSYDELYVVTGPVFDSIIGYIGADSVAVPGYFYKIIYDPDPEPRMVAFLMPNKKVENSFMDYMVSVDSVEKRTGIDFFCQLPDQLEDSLESTIEWDYLYIVKSKPAPKDPPTKTWGQCKGIAKSTGERCKCMTTNPNGYCKYHQSQVPQ